MKYRLLCKRLIEERKRVGVIQYYNVLFIMELVFFTAIQRRSTMS